jgi:UDP-N-acetylmuramate dehydrogenase
MLSRLAAIPHLLVLENAPLARYTRFAVGGPAGILADARTEDALTEAVAVLTESRAPFTVIGGGTNLLVSDEGFAGVVLRYVNASIEIVGISAVAAAGAPLQNLVDAAINAGLRGLETMTGIPGWVGGAVYGNAGAYGHSLEERVTSVRYFDGSAVRQIDNAACEFHYRESIFKRRKDWIVLSATFGLTPGDSSELRTTADGILAIRNQKYPPTMRCAGSIFKNLLWGELPDPVRAAIPANIVREGKIPSAYFLEQSGAKGMVNGGMHVAEYHANLIYNQDGGTASEARELILKLKQRVFEKFGLELEEEVQYVPPFPPTPSGIS